jgi:hypothetical protein
MKILEMILKNLKINAKHTTLTILVPLGILAFASASGAFSKHLITATEDTVYCKPQKGSSADLWTCYDYYGNEFKNLLITQSK